MIIKAITESFRQAKPRLIYLPPRFNVDTMRIFLAEIVDDEQDPRYDSIALDFSRLDFVEPVGVVVLSNAIEFVRSRKGKVQVIRPSNRSDGITFLDDSMFFRQYAGETLSHTAKTRPSTMPLKRIHSGQAQQFLHDSMMPWIAGHVDMDPASLSGMRVAIEEILHNVQDHSGYGVGCTFAQHFPQKQEIQLAISDFGHGIPTVVRRKEPGVSDAQAICLAFREGFTTQSNVKNRGAGLPNLIHWVVNNNKGTILVASGRGQASAVLGARADRVPKLTYRTKNGNYPGTLVRVVLRTDTLGTALDDARPERFEW